MPDDPYGKNAARIRALQIWQRNAKPLPRKSRSGPTIDSATRRARGQELVAVRAPEGTMQRLRDLMEKRGAGTLGEILLVLLDEAEARLKGDP